MNIVNASKALGLKVRTVREWIKLGKLPAQKIGNHFEIPEEVIFCKEVQERANKGRERSKRIEAGKQLGVLARSGKDSEESI